MTVVFFVDPALAKDAEQDDLDSITLSYTMYAVRQRAPPRVERGTRACSRTELISSGSAPFAPGRRD